MTLLPEDKAEFIAICLEDAIDRIAECKTLSWQILRWAVTLVIVVVGFDYAAPNVPVLIVPIPLLIAVLCLAFLSLVGHELKSHRDALRELRERIGGTVHQVYKDVPLRGSELALSPQSVIVFLFAVGASIFLALHHYNELLGALWAEVFW